MYNRLVIEGNAVYEIDDECVRRRQGRKGHGGKNRGSAASGSPSPGTDPVK
ncbi:MAG: hypothetical protein LUE94_03620 [Clostridiales bacterium]|nr:hypothetical protein [Clostridiales bacterium]